MMGTDLQVRRAHSHQPDPVRIGQGRPADIGLVAILLRHDVRHILIIHAAAMPPDTGPGQAIDVALLWAPPEPGHLVQAGRQA